MAYIIQILFIVVLCPSSLVLLVVVFAQVLPFSPLCFRSYLCSDVDIIFSSFVAVHCCLCSGVPIHTLSLLFCAGLCLSAPICLSLACQVLPFSALCFRSYLCSGVAILCSHSLLRAHIATNYCLYFDLWFPYCACHY